MLFIDLSNILIAQVTLITNNNYKLLYMVNLYYCSSLFISVGFPCLRILWKKAGFVLCEEIHHP